MGRIRVTSRIIPWADQEVDGKLDRAMLSAATDIDRTAAQLAPVLTRNLVNSKKIERRGPGWYIVSFGSPKVPYARRRHFENEKNPQTLHYLQRAGDSVARNLGKYFR